MSSWTNEAFRFLLILALSAIVGGLTGQTTLFLLIGLLGYLLFHIRNFYRLWEWLRDGGRREPPESQGIWNEIFEGLYRLKQKDQRSKKRLGEELKRFRKSSLAIPDALMLIDADDCIAWMNPAAAALFGLRRKRDIGNRIHNLVRHPAFVSYLANPYGKPVEFPSPDSPERTVEVSLVPTSDRQRLVWARDVSHVKKMNRVRQDFVANASHELRTPLTVIVGYLDSLQGNDSVPESVAPAITAMQTQASRMQLIIRDLLVLIRLESDSMDAQSGPVRVAEMIEEIVEEVRHRGGEQIDIHVKIDRDIGLVGNRGELYSAFSNLLNNALDYTTDEGKIVVRWKAKGNSATFSVADNGIGISPEHLSRLTERFYRVGDGRGRNPNGTGLGLSIVKHVLIRHDSALEIASEVNRGSTFSCSFPEARVIRVDEPQLQAVG